jgi:hypothetical protein
MGKFVLNRDYVMRTTRGHSIRFEKGQPTWVPVFLEREAVAIGAAPVEGEVDMGEKKDEKPEVTPEDRKARFFAAFKTLETRNARGDFNGNGRPAKAAVEKLTQLDTQAAEIEALWDEYRREQQ